MGVPGEAVDYEAALHRAGLRITRQRHAVIAILSGFAAWPDVAEVHARARAVDGRVSLATVYRTMHALEASGAGGRR